MSALYLIYKDKTGIEHSVYFDIVTSINHIGESQASEFPLEDGAPMTDHVINLPSNLTFTASVSNSPMKDNPGAKLTSFSDGTLTYPNINPSPAIYPPLQYPTASAPTLASIGNNLNLAGGISAVASAIGLGPNLTPQPTSRSAPLTVPTIPNQPNTSGNFISETNRVQDMFNLLELIRTSNFLCEIITEEKTYSNMVLLTINSPRTVDTGNSLEFTVTAKQIRLVTLAQADVPVPAELIAAVKRKTGSKNGVTNTGEGAQNNQLDKSTGNASAIAAKENMLKANVQALGT